MVLKTTWPFIIMESNGLAPDQYTGLFVLCRLSCASVVSRSTSQICELVDLDDVNIWDTLHLA